MASHDIKINITADASGVKNATAQVQKNLSALGNMKVKTPSIKPPKIPQVKVPKLDTSAFDSALDGIKGKIAAAFAVGSIVSFGKSALQASANAELLKKGLAFNLGNESAEQLIANMQQIGEASAYDTSQLTPMARAWVNIGDNAEQATAKMQTIVDAGSAYGLSVDQIDRVNTALTQMQMKGKISAEEMMQLTEAGLPAWNLLSEQMGVPVATLQDMASKGELTQDAMNALFDGMKAKTEGAASSLSDSLMGKFSNMQEALTNSLSGVGDIISKAFDVPGILDQLGEVAQSVKTHVQSIRDAVESGGSIGQAFSNELQKISPVAGDVANTVLAAFNKIKEVVSENEGKIKALITVIGSIAATVAVWHGVASAIAGVKTALAAAKVAALAFRAACAANPVLLAVSLIVAALTLLYAHWDEVTAIASACLDTVTSKCSEVASAIEDTVGGAIQTVKGWWNDLVTAFSHPIDFVVNETRNITENIFGSGGKAEANGGINGGPMRRFAKGGLVGGQIPALANGGQIKHGTPAIVGEAGPEAVIPLKKEVLSKIGEAMYRASVNRQNVERAIEIETKGPAEYDENGQRKELTQQESDAQKAAIEARKASLDAEDMLNEIQQKLVDKQGTKYQGAVLANAKELVDMRAQIRALTAQGADPALIEQLTASADEYERVLKATTEADQLEAIREFTAQAKESYAEATHDYEAMAEAEYEATRLKLDKERQDKERELMRDADDAETRLAIEKDYNAKVLQAQEKRDKALRESHANHISYLKEEGRLAAIIADAGMNGSAWDKEMHLEGMKTLSDEFIEYTKVLHEGWSNYVASVSSELYSTMTDDLTEFIKGAKSATEAIEDFGKTILNMMAKIAAQRLAANWMSGILGNLVGGSKASAFSWGGTSHSSTFGFNMTSPLGFAKGGIVTAPTLAMIGEAGENEAVIPLNNKNLAALGGGKSGGVTVNIVNNTDSRVGVQSSKYDEGLGQWVLDIVVDGAQRNKGGFGANLKTALGAR